MPRRVISGKNMSNKSKNRNGRLMEKSPKPVSHSMAKIFIPTPHSPCDWLLEWSKVTSKPAKPFRLGRLCSGAFQRSDEHNNQPPFNLPKRWLDQKEKINLDTPYNFVSTVDIIGGNSGSPVFNRDAELVGIIFDGNLQSLVWDFVYNDVQGRAVAVHSSAIIEALQKIYNAQPLADELIKGRLPR